MPVVQDEISLVKVANGDDGRGILGTPVATYAQSTSGTIPPTSWSATRPNVPADQYLWTRVVTTYTDNTTSETQTPTLMGAEGESGLGIKDKSISYAVGTSGNTPPTSGWQETIPTVSANQYLWTKTTLIYTDESKTEAYSVGKMGANGADAKLLYLTASAENMAFNADDTPKTTQTINISAKLQNVIGTATFTAIPYIGNTAQTAITLGGTGNTRTLTSAQWTNKNWTLIAITATLDNLSDTLSIVKVKDGATGDKGDQGNQGIPGTPGADGKTPYTHWAYAWSADGKDRFTSSYPIENILIGTTSDTQTLTTNSGWPDKTGATNALMAVGADRLVKAGDTITYSAFITAPADVRAYIYVRLNRPGASNGSYEDKTSNRLDPGTSGWCSVTVTVPSDTTSLRFTVGRYENSNAVTRTLSWASEKAEKSDKRTIYTPSPADDFANAYPTYAGTYTDYEPTDSEDPSKYTWQRILGESGQDGKDGIAGKAGVGVSDTSITYAQSTSGTTPPTTGWTAQVPTLVKGQYLWTKTVWTYTDETTETGYTVSYNAKDGNDGNDGIAGKDGVGISNTIIEYIGSTSGTTKPTTGWTASIPTVPAGQYLWTRTTWQYTDGTSEQGFTNALMGRTGASGKDGVAGKDGVGIKSTQIMYAQSTSGTTAPTTGWTAQVPTLIKGQYLWTQTTWVYTDNTGEAGYTVSYNAKDGNTGKDGIAGKDGVGIANTLIQYVGSTSGTTKPTSGWSTTIPTVAEGNYLWTRTTWTYTDNTSEMGYSVAKMGVKGDKGDPGNQGIPGTPGADGKTPYTHWAYAWSADGKDRFTTSYPNENLLRTTTNTATIVGMAQSNQTDARTDFTLSTTPFNTLWADMKVGDTFTFSCDVTISGSGFTGQFRPQTHYSPYVAMGSYYNVTKAETVRVGMATVFLTNFIRCRTSFRMLFRLSLTMSLLGCDDLRQELTV
ncbi:hypothetical protein ACFC9R_10000, partial [Enterococcus casseliflavus]